MTLSHCSLEIEQGLLLHMGKVLGTLVRPRELIFLGYFAHLWLNVGNDAICCTPKGYYAMVCQSCYMPLKIY